MSSENNEFDSCHSMNSVLQFKKVLRNMCRIHLELHVRKSMITIQALDTCNCASEKIAQTVRNFKHLGLCCQYKE